MIAAAVIGGANLAGGGGTALGAIIGACLIEVIRNGACLIEVIRNSLGLLGINAFWQGTFIGGAILFACCSTGWPTTAATPEPDGSAGRKVRI